MTMWQEENHKRRLSPHLPCHPALVVSLSGAVPFLMILVDSKEGDALARRNKKSDNGSRVAVLFFQSFSSYQKF